MASPIVPRRDLTGQRFGRWTVLGFAGRKNFPKGRPAYMWLCRCECGTERAVSQQPLCNGGSKSCGCLTNEIRHSIAFVHGGRRTPEYQVWCKIKARCCNPNDIGYENYGGRGIKICDRWLHSFADFIQDLGERPSNDHSIDRVDVNGDYEPSNCRWALPDVQHNNKRNSVLLEWNGLKLTPAQWGRKLNIRAGVIRDRIQRGWSISKALSEPVKLNSNETALRTCCGNGHPYPENPTRRSNGSRACAQCDRQYCRRARERKCK